MTQIQPSVERVLESPTEGANATLIVGVEAGYLSRVKSSVSEFAEVEEEVPVNCLAVRIKETDIHRLSDLDGVISIEVEGTWEAQSQGNLNSPQGTVTRRT